MTAVRLRCRYRLYPDAAQREAPARAFGCARVVFDDGLRLRQEAREAGLPYVSDGESSKRVITEAKKTPERAWLGEVSAVVLQQALADLNSAYRAFFASVAGKRKGPKVAPPRFRSKKDNRQAIRFTRNARFTVTAGGRLRLPKIGEVPVRWSRGLPSDPSSVTVVKDAAGRCFASFVVETADEPLPQAAAETGIDLGLTHFAVTSDGSKDAVERPVVDLFVWRGPRPGRQRGDQHPGRRTGGQAKRLWRGGGTTACGGTTRRSRNPLQAARVLGGLAGENPRPSRRGGRQNLLVISAILALRVLVVVFRRDR
ncbi:RNA-guided endonuclease InsQ/TnpB family protein [Streptosporangium sandarakinum]|uniref:RNA-guided endonuclease InsQ/TnpB family protein n=1 Tax=Streptosporangium sandarakinum TaxID=1260955 RepID=UPI003F4CB526